MTEASENAYLVRVRAQVMCRDEGTGGWVALGGGGLADVMVGKRARYVHTSSGGESSNGDSTSSMSTPSHDYFIHGKRISDNMVVLECTIKKDFQYNKVMPTFHHWVTDEKRFGLTFQTAADARAFDKGVRTAIEELLDGLGGAWPSVHTYKKCNSGPKEEEDEENNIFECLNLPSEPHSSAENSTASRARRRAAEELSLTQTPILSVITLPKHGADNAHPLQDQSSDSSDDPTYVSLSAVHDYQYPAVSGVIIYEQPRIKPQSARNDPGGAKKSVYSDRGPQLPLPLPDIKKPANPFPGRHQCRHCHMWYNDNTNGAGVCEFAPDYFKSCINTVSCIKCAQCMVYHCMTDSEGDFSMRPCACAPPEPHCMRRWMGVTLLSLCFPCLWCYWPLRCIHWMAKSVHMTGGHHVPYAPNAPFGPRQT